MKKILVIFGTRPEAIKLCPLVLEFKKHPKECNVVVCVTAQHRQMLDQVLKVFDVVPDYDLNVMKDNQTLTELTTNCLGQLGQIIKKESPDMVVVQGDTTTTYTGALAAYYEQVQVGHVEAGLRTGNKYSPFPEEMNRKMTTAIADYHFAPTDISDKNLQLENVDNKTIFITGNTVIDALLWVKNKIDTENKNFNEFDDVDFSKKIILVTGHRRENFGDGFSNVCHALKSIALKHEDVEIVFPVHLNPNVRKPVNEILSEVNNIKLIEPLDYEPFIYIMDKSYLIMTDSGGIQEEAPSLAKPTIVTRENTERQEAVTAGVVKLVGTDSEKIISEIDLLLTDQDAYKSMANKDNPYGDGNASAKIVSAILSV